MPSEAEKLYTCTARCGVCGAVLNTAEHVPHSERGRIVIGAPMMAICKVRGHNTLSGLNLKVNLDWEEEPDAEP